MQIIGNKSAHDNFITKEEGLYCIQALNLLSEWLFLEHLKISYPKSLVIDEEIKKELPPTVKTTSESMIGAIVVVLNLLRLVQQHAHTFIKIIIDKIINTLLKVFYPKFNTGLFE
ncbi:MAG: hypothetical protein H0U95_06495 [Bacteroidetes bacterium]|nr:hypothetical protein [Bacteroidota bacterium]